MESDGLNGEGRVPTSAAITITRAGYASESNSSGLGSDDDGLPMASGRSTEPPAQEQERVRKVSIEAVAESVPVPSFERASSAGTANQSVEDDVSLRIDQSGAEAATSFARHPSSTNRRVSESDKFESFLSDVTDEAPLALSVPLPNVAGTFSACFSRAWQGLGFCSRLVRVLQLCHVTSGRLVNTAPRALAHPTFAHAPILYMQPSTLMTMGPTRWWLRSMI
jgi:hypothetical protein